MQLDMVTVQGAFLDNVGPSEALFQLSEHMQSNPLLYGRSATLPCGRQRSSTLEGCSGGSFNTPCGWTFWQGL